MPPRYIATIPDVREVALAATADADYWAAHLRTEQLFPYRNGDRAELTISAPNLSWMGIRFTELVATVHTSNREDGATRDGQFLIAAFSTSRLLAWMERAFFKTGYRPARIDFRPNDLPGFTLGLPETALLARQAPRDSEAEWTDERWEGRVHLPGRRFFHVLIAGPTQRTLFLPACDTFQASPPGHPLARWLTDSAFQPVEWHVRNRATHARSKTLRRE